MPNKEVLKDNHTYELSDEIVSILLMDRSSNENLIWATDTYAEKGPEFGESEHITLDLVTGKNSKVIKPRINKSKTEQINRVKNKGEVFTPSWVCNKQNNLVDTEWFGYKDAFNSETADGWVTKLEKVVFPEGKTWEDYISLQRMEITCGEAPYIVSRYDTVSGNYIDIKNRIGLLDRKFRVISENVTSEDEWYAQSLNAIKSIYAYDWQGDNVFLARQNILFSTIDYFMDKFKHMPTGDYIRDVAIVVSWNVWQMDGLKCVIPNSCHKEPKITLFEDCDLEDCPGCANGDYTLHNGIKCKIMDWVKKESYPFVNSIKKGGINYDI